MKKIIAIFIAILILAIASPVSSFSKEDHKKHHFKLIRHRKRERMRKWNSGHTEFKNRSKRDRRRIGRHHLKPDYKPKHHKHKEHSGKGKSDSGKGEKDSDNQDDKQAAPADSGDKDTPKGDSPPKDSPPGDTPPKDTPPGDSPPKDNPPGTPATPPPPGDPGK